MLFFSVRVHGAPTNALHATMLKKDAYYYKKIATFVQTK